eukprot:230875_1
MAAPNKTWNQCNDGEIWTCIGDESDIPWGNRTQNKTKRCVPNRKRRLQTNYADDSSCVLHAPAAKKRRLNDASSTNNHHYDTYSKQMQVEREHNQIRIHKESIRNHKVCTEHKTDQSKNHNVDSLSLGLFMDGLFEKVDVTLKIHDEDSPHIIFSKPITLNNRSIHWIHTKNQFLSRNKAWYKLRNKCVKFAKRFGNGAVICRGFDSELKSDTDVLLLDASCHGNSKCI